MKEAQKKKHFIDGIQALDSILQDINEIPRQKSEECQKKISQWLKISLLPLGNIGVLYSIITMIKQFVPALTSQNSFYIQFKQTLVKQFKFFSYIHFSLTVICGIGLFLVGASARLLLYFVTFTYLVSTIVIYLKCSQLKKYGSSLNSVDKVELIEK